MTNTYWDPGNLLQITDPDNPVEIRCVGRAQSRFDARCRWTLDEPDRLAIRSRLGAMAASPPSKVASKDLESLAKLCLCHQYHYDQWKSVSRRWTPVVGLAAQHCNRLSEDDGAQKINSLLLERRRCLEALEQPQDDNRDLALAIRVFVASRSMQSSVATDTIAQLKAELSVAQNNLSASQKKLQGVTGDLQRAKAQEIQLDREHGSEMLRIESTHRAEISRQMGLIEEAKNDRERLNGAVCGLHIELESVRRLLDEERRRVAALEEAKASLGSELKAANGKVEDKTIECSTAMGQVTQLRGDLESARDDIRLLNDRCSVLDKTLLQSQQDLKMAQKESEELREGMATLQERVVAQQHDISSCWLHRFRAWINTLFAKPWQRGYSSTLEVV
ncbi:hypothetical protein OQA88_5995 [Cercophora sp. LCS_1]